MHLPVLILFFFVIDDIYDFLFPINSIHYLVALDHVCESDHLELPTLYKTIKQVPPTKICK